MKEIKKSSALHLHNTAVRCDEFDRYIFGRIKDKAPRLGDLEERGTGEIPTFPGLLQDCFSALYKLEPELRPAGEVLPSHRPHRRLLEQVMGTEDYQELRAYTTLQEFEAAMASEVVGDRALQFFSEEQKEQIREMQSEEEKSESFQEQVEGLQAAAQAAQEAANQASAEAEEAEQQGDSQTAQEFSAKASQFQTQADSLSAQAQNAQMSLEEAKQRLEQMSAEMEEWFDQHSDEVRQACRKIAQSAKEEVEETSEFLEAWGDEAGELRRGDPAKAREYAERIRNSRKLRELAKLVGRLKRLALNKAKTKAESRAEVVDVSHGRDLRNLLPSERRRLAHPLFQKEFLRRWASSQLLIFKKKDKEKMGKGPIVVCEDGSGSMSGGEKEIWAKAVSLALAEVARFQKRNFAWIHFGAEYSPLSVEQATGGKVTPELMFSIAETFLDASGTDFETPLAKAQEIIEETEFKRADVVFITDGHCTVSDEFLENFRKTKREKEFQVVAVPINIGGSCSLASLEEFADNIIPVSQLSAGEAGEIFDKI
ncbi:MAG: Protein ViaA [Syntrophomonadaceae bacterium]|nr:Protein ViaA [Bacillota bacterium]